MSISTLKWPLLQTMAPSGMAWKCSLRRMPLLPVTVTKTLADLRRLGHGHHLEAVHHRLEGPRGIDLGHDHARPRAPGAQGHARARTHP